LFEVLLVLLAALWFLFLPVAILVLAVAAFVRSRRIVCLERRMEQLESRLGGQALSPPLTASATAGEATEIEALQLGAEIEPAEPPAAARGPRIRWESLIGEKAFGWMAVVLAIFAAAFFLKYAYDNDWIGPLGRVAVGEIAGCALMIVGLRHFLRHWRAFSQMLSACGVVVLFLSTYTAFGFYHLLPSREAGAFMAVVIALSMVAAVLYDSLAVATVATLGGLLTPVLLPTEVDAYVALFTYLVALNLGVWGVVFVRAWPAMGSIALVGTQLLFWMWYEAKLPS